MTADREQVIGTLRGFAVGSLVLAILTAAAGAIAGIALGAQRDEPMIALGGIIYAVMLVFAGLFAWALLAAAALGLELLGDMRDAACITPAPSPTTDPYPEPITVRQPSTEEAAAAEELAALALHSGAPAVHPVTPPRASTRPPRQP